MSKLTGTLRREGMAGQVIVLEGDDGRRYLLGGATKALRGEAGRRVELEGEVDPEGVSIEMSGAPVFRVKRSRGL